MSAAQSASSDATYLVENGRNNFLKDHVLVGSWREDLVELVCLIAERIGAHGKLNGGALDAICRHHNAAVFAHFAVVAASAAHDDIDISLFAFVKVALFALQW